MTPWPRPAGIYTSTETYWPRPAARTAEVESFWPEPARTQYHYPNLLALYKLLGTTEMWRQDAQCRKENIPTEEFFPWRGRSQVLAKSVCARCSVQVNCREYAEEYDMRGIWGGKIYSR